jgi:hypothetical protein
LRDKLKKQSSGDVTRTRQIADFLPLKAACEATVELNVDDAEHNLAKAVLEQNSQTIDQFVQSEAEKPAF